jgi:putative ABC transport system substrate-binding protein
MTRSGHLDPDIAEPHNIASSAGQCDRLQSSVRRGRSVRRRDFITLVGGSAAAWPLALRAQQPDRIRRIGVLTALSQDYADARAWLAAFEQELQRLGWESGRNIRFEYRFGGGDEDRDDRIRAYATDLVEIAPDILFASGPSPLLALHKLTRSLAVVFVQVADPVKLGVLENLAHPGGNITGFVAFEHAIASKWVELLKDTAPDITRSAIIFDPQNPFQVPYLEVAEAAGPTLGMQLVRTPVRNAADIERAITAFAQEPKGSLLVLPSVPALIHRDLIIALAARHHLPAVYPYRTYPQGGGLISYGVDPTDIYRRAASYVDLILRGAKPGDLPVQLPTKIELIVNLKTAKALGLSIPEPFLQRADEVIE